MPLLIPPVLQDPSTGEPVEEATDDDGVLVLAPARREHSGRYQCQGLDLESTASLLSDPQELQVDCKRGPAGGADDPRPALADATALPPDVSDVWVLPTAPEAQEGGNLTLTCGADSSQGLEFQWLREKVRAGPGAGSRAGSGL